MKSGQEQQQSENERTAVFGHAVKTCALKSLGGIGKVAVTAS